MEAINYLAENGWEVINYDIQFVNSSVFWSTSHTIGYALVKNTNQSGQTWDE